MCGQVNFWCSISAGRKLTPAALLGCLLLLGACAARVPPHLHPDPVPPLPEPAPLAWEPAGDDCPAPAPYLPGRPAPHTEGGLATCRAVLVPEARLAELLRLEADAELWRSVAHLHHAERERERRACQAEYDRAWAGWRDAVASSRRGAVTQAALVAACMASHAVR